MQHQLIAHVTPLEFFRCGRLACQASVLYACMSVRPGGREAFLQPQLSRIMDHNLLQPSLQYPLL